MADESKEERMFFFEKKNRKTFARWHTRPFSASFFAVPT